MTAPVRCSEVRKEIHLGRIGFWEFVLVLDGVFGFGALFLLLGFYRVEFEVGEE
jgi:hypothetical protein